jgi:hypothetical protein
MQMEAMVASRDTVPEPDPARGRPMAEPATARALWPTFMRRTLPEETLRREDAAAQPGC